MKVNPKVPLLFEKNWITEGKVVIFIEFRTRQISISATSGFHGHNNRVECWRFFENLPLDNCTRSCILNFDVNLDTGIVANSFYFL